MSDTIRITRLARLLGWLTIGLMVVIPLALLGILVAGGLGRAVFQAGFPEIPVAETLTATQRAFVVMLAVTGIAAILYTLDQMRRLFARYARADILSRDSAAIILRIGIGLVAIGIIAVVIYPLQAMLLTWGNPPGEKVFALSISETQIGFLLSGGLLTVIGWAMRDAAAVAEENRGFV